MPYRKTTVRRKILTSEITGARVNAMFTGPVGVFSGEKADPDFFAEILFRGSPEATREATIKARELQRQFWRKHWRQIIRWWFEGVPVEYHHWAFDEPDDIGPHASLENLWAAAEFGLPRGAKALVKGLAYQKAHSAPANAAPGGA